MSELDWYVPEIQIEESKPVAVKLGTSKSDFEKFLIDAVDQELSILGDDAKKATYSCLKGTFGIKKHEIPNKIEEFAFALERIFGAGAKVLEVRIIESVCRRVNNFKYFPKHGDIFFADYLIALRSHL